jgi:hypothetical protein
LSRSSQNTIDVQDESEWGKLTLKTLAFELPEDRKAQGAVVAVDGESVRSAFSQEGKRVQIELPEKSVIDTGSQMGIKIET